MSDTHIVITSIYMLIYIYRFNFYFYCFHLMDILKINNCVVLIIDFFGFKSIFISFLMIGNWLSFYLII